MSRRGNRNDFLAILAVLFATLVVSGPVVASDLEKEKRWSEQIIDQLFDGEARWLDAADVHFLSLYTQPEGSDRGGVVVIHGLGVHPDWAQVVNPLRVGLADAGWHTLSLQMPVLPNGVPTSDYRPLLPGARPRIEAGVKSLRGVTAGPIFIVAHSLGTAMTITALVGNPALEVSGFVGIGMSAGSDGSMHPTAALLGTVNVPVLDLYGEFDNERVLVSATRRAVSVAGSDYSQQVIPGANHFFDGYEAPLLTAVSNWLDQQTIR